MRKKTMMMLFLLPGFLALIALGGFVVQWLWNWLLPSLFDVRRVTFWEALGLLALCRILFGGFGRGRGPHRRWRQPPPDRPVVEM
jgi:hypothetical protein